MSAAPRRAIFMLLLFCLASGWPAPLRADDPPPKPAPPLPADKSLWLNSSPLTWEELRGKGVYLYYFSCDPEGAEDLPKHVEAARKHALDPVIFVGVAMGNSRREAEAYLKPLGFTWPVFCDPTYSYTHLSDTAMGIADTDKFADSLCGVAYVTHDGLMSEGWWDEPEATITEALDNAKWTTDPKGLPESVLPVWRAVELRKFSEALPLIRKGVNSGTDEHKSAVASLKQVVQEEIDRRADEARAAAEQEDRKWTAYRQASRVIDEFKGYDVPNDLDPLVKKLARSSQVKAGLTAEKQLTIAAQGLTAPNPAQRKRAQLQLEKIIADFPDTDLAESARKLLDNAPMNPAK